MKHQNPLLKTLPKADLHVHLDGSLRLKTLIELAQSSRVKLPSYTESGLLDLVFKPTFHSLDDYLTCFKYPVQLFKNKENIERCSYELACDNLAEGVYYLEVRFAPELHISQNCSLEDAIASAARGLEKAAHEHNQSPEVCAGQRPPFIYGIIVCAMRHFAPNGDNSLAHLHNAALDLTKRAIACRDNQGLPIVGLDVVGREVGWNAQIFKGAYDCAHQNLLQTTTHAGEALGAKSIFDAVAYLCPDRIGHALHLFNTNQTDCPDCIQSKKFTEQLADFIGKIELPIEVCISSNFQTNPTLKSLEDHVVTTLLKRDMPFVLCTDNRLVSHTTVTHEYEILLNHHPLEPAALKKIIISGFHYGFYAGTLAEKQAFIRQIDAFYDSVIAKA